MYRRILVPTDFSEPASQALDHALRLAEAVGAEVILFHAFVRPALPTLPASDKALREYIEQSKREVDEQLRTLAGRCHTVSCRAITVEGQPAREIIAAAQREGCDLVCMSTHGHGNLAHVFLGTVTEKVMHKTRCPLLVVTPLSRGERPPAEPDAGETD